MKKINKIKNRILRKQMNCFIRETNYLKIKTMKKLKIPIKLLLKKLNYLQKKKKGQINKNKKIFKKWSKII